MSRALDRVSPLAPAITLLLLAMAGSAETRDGEAMHAAGVDHAGAPTVVIGVSPAGLMPQVGRATPEQALAWLSFTNRPVTVRFEASVADEMRCKTPTPFRVEGEHLVAQLGEGGFASFCQLGWGEYPYEVVVAGASGGERRHRGTIVVK